jgi:sirohydrochlorin ferrochelatase
MVLDMASLCEDGCFEFSGVKPLLSKGTSMMRVNILLLATISLLTACSQAERRSAASSEHDHHASHMIEAKPDEQGRLLFGMKHEMDAEMLAELQEKPVFSGYTDEQLVKVMSLMGPNYTWPVSDPGMSAKKGALILVHGFGGHGDAVLRNQLGPTSERQPTTLAIGMSMMTSDHIQAGIQTLEDSGARKIVVVPVVSTRHNTLMRQWDFIFGLNDTPEYGRVPQVTSSAKLKIVEPLDDHPLVGEILVDYANEISTDPAREEVIIVGHGPVDDDDNREQLALMENLADYLRAEKRFAAVHVASLQDDAPREVRMARIRELRERVFRANQNGRDVLIVTNLLGTRIVQSGLRRALSGLEYKFNSKGLIEHENFIKWITASIDDGLN